MLRLERVTRRFGGIEAVAALDLDLPDGARLGLIGPNGSGKTTVLNLISGVLAPDGGAILWDGARIDGQPAHRLARLGIARTFQNLRLVAHMTVRENVWLAQHTLPGAAALRRGTAAEVARARRVDELLEALGLGAWRDAPVAALPLPQQRRVELARALAREPRLLLLDEPAGGMTPAETQAMGDLIARLVPPAMTLVVVEHKLDLVAKLCPRVAVLDFGRKIAEGAPAGVLRDPKVMEVYFGRDRDAGDFPPPRRAGEG
jgi:ABC-type branched-subunit amino acid transport system ATPase component